ncbi:MAG: hypothetical protein QW343_01545 [Candidatus Norongarragalinales archaeon]
MKKRVAYSLLFSFLAVSFTAFASAECLFLEIASINDASVSRGVTAHFPISIRNIGSSAQFVSLGGSCVSDLECSFDSSSATLASGEARVFTLSVGTARATSNYYELPVRVTASGGTTPCAERVARLSVSQPAPTATPSPSSGFYASLSPSGVVSSARPGEVIEYELLVSNSNAAKGFVKIRVEDAFASSTLLSTTNFDLAGGTSKRVTAKVRLPLGTPGGSYETVFRVSVTSGASGETTEFSLPAAIFVFSDAIDLDLLNQPVECLQVKHEEEFVWPFELRNNGQAKGPFVIVLEAPSEVKDFARVAPSLLELESGDQQPLELRLTPSSRVTLATYQLKLLVKYLDYVVLSVPLCVNVSGAVGFTVEKQEEYAVKRGVVTPLKITVTNKGSVSDDFSIEPAIVSWLNAQAIPSSFSLSPHESRSVNIVVSTALDKTPLGTKFLPVVVRSLKTTASELYLLKLKISAAPQAGLSYLTIKKTRFTAPAGNSVDDVVEVLNSKDDLLRGVTLSIVGIPSAWYSVSPATRDIPPKSTALFNVTWSVPQSKAGRYSITLYAESVEGEAAAANATLDAVAPSAGLTSSVADVDYSRFESTGEITVTVVLRNTGGTALSGITAAAPSGFAFSNAVAPISLAPGEEKSVTLSLKPTGAVSPDARLELAFQSSEGVAAPPITVFAAPPQKKTNNGSWVLLSVIALVLLVAAAAYYFYKEHGGRSCERGESSAEAQLEARERAETSGRRFTQKKLV